MEEGRWQEVRIPSTNKTDICALANSCRSHTQTPPPLPPSIVRVVCTQGHKGRLPTHLQRTHNHTQRLLQLACGLPHAHIHSLVPHKPRPPRTCTSTSTCPETHPSALPPWASQTQAPSGSRQPSGLEPRDGWHRVMGHGKAGGGCGGGSSSRKTLVGSGGGSVGSGLAQHRVGAGDEAVQGLQECNLIGAGSPTSAATWAGAPGLRCCSALTSTTKAKQGL